MTGPVFSECSSLLRRGFFKKKGGKRKWEEKWKSGKRGRGGHRRSRSSLFHCLRSLYLSPLERERGLCGGESECSEIFIKYTALIVNSVENKVVKMMFCETFASKHRGALYSTNKKIPELPISGQELNTRDFFRNKYFGILGIPCEIVLTFREIGTT